MKFSTPISSIFIAGISYKKADTRSRGQFAISQGQYEQIFAAAPSYGIKEFFVLSTCNRTEIYGIAEDVKILEELLCSVTEGTIEDFRESSYVLNGQPAIRHLFQVSSGMDSQILGDYEIVGQLKQSVKISKERGFIGPTFERLVNEVLRAAKNVRTNTGFSSGTVSVSFAAVQYIKAHFTSCDQKKVLLVGTGKIGSNTCKNLVDYLPGSNITVVNRTPEKAAQLAEQFGVAHDSIDNLTKCINESDIILVAISSEEPLIVLKDIQHSRSKLIIDLSVPCSVSSEIGNLEHVTLVNVDELSKIKDETLKKRAAEIPLVINILEKHLKEFLEWHEMRQHVPVLKAVKSKLLLMHSIEIESKKDFHVLSSAYHSPEEKIQKVINGMAIKMRTQPRHGCFYIEAINDFMAASTS